jgi:hypothetical protein
MDGELYLRKPDNWDDWKQMVKSLHDFWFTRAKLPKH